MNSTILVCLGVIVALVLVVAMVMRNRRARNR
jgi:hypothetical protein